MPARTLLVPRYRTRQYRLSFHGTKHASTCAGIAVPSGSVLALLLLSRYGAQRGVDEILVPAHLGSVPAVPSRYAYRHTRVSVQHCHQATRTAIPHSSTTASVLGDAQARS
eukprot:3819195-Rhodomonas_salina.1